MKLSYWEINKWFSDIDFAIVGSGIVGLHCAIRLRELHPNAKILVLEKGTLPEGASTKNAGFACFGSISEIIDDLNNHSEQDVIDLIIKRKQGLQLLRNGLGDNNIDFEQHGGYEVFLDNDTDFYENCLNQIPFINQILEPVFNATTFVKTNNNFRFQNVNRELIFNPNEGQIDTGKMMQCLLKKAICNNILILNNQTVTDYYETNQEVQVSLNDFNFKTKKLLFATNGFAASITKNQVQPARAQVLITEPIPNLSLRGTFHLDQGYFYFRNINNRILLGGGRNLDFEGETTTEIGVTDLIQNRLEELLKKVILPNQEFKIAYRWSGIMGMGESKKPIVSQLSDHVYCGVRLGGMGVAIGSLVGKELAELSIK